MQYQLSIKTITLELDTGNVLAVREEPVGTATEEQLHAWLSAGDNRIWNGNSPASLATIS